MIFKLREALLKWILPSFVLIFSLFALYLEKGSVFDGLFKILQVMLMFAFVFVVLTYQRDALNRFIAKVSNLSVFTFQRKMLNVFYNLVTILFLVAIVFRIIKLFTGFEQTDSFIIVGLAGLIWVFLIITKVSTAK